MFQSLSGTEPVSVPVIVSGSFMYLPGTETFSVLVIVFGFVSYSTWHGTCLRACNCIWFWFTICMSWNLSRTCHCVCQCFSLCLARNLSQCLSLSLLNSFKCLPGMEPLLAAGKNVLSQLTGMSVPCQSISWQIHGRELGSTIIKSSPFFLVFFVGGGGGGREGRRVSCLGSRYEAMLEMLQEKTSQLSSVHCMYTCSNYISS